MMQHDASNMRMSFIVRVAVSFYRAAAETLFMV